MLPWKTIIKIEVTGSPVYLQIANSFITEMKSGRLGPGIKLPSTRTLAEILNVHRKTIIHAYDELFAQGWIDIIKIKGAFTSLTLPETNETKVKLGSAPKGYPQRSGYALKINPILHEPSKPKRSLIGFHDGPDVRLIPTEIIGKTYRSLIKRKTNKFNLSYVDVDGPLKLRNALSLYLNDTRGLQTKAENIMITRGSQMAIFLISQMILSKGDHVIVGDTNYYYANNSFLYAGANLMQVKVDDFGIDVDQIEKICSRKKIRAIYVTSHHHYPTTVTLSAARRIKLLSLAEKFGFVIIEDDYDYDFHYLSSPILPLASFDKQGMVIYIGTFSKSVSPACRVGYISAPINVINELCKLREIIDVQGDPIMELVIAELLENGELRRHMKKILKIYRNRRDVLVEELQKHLSKWVNFKIPDGGIAIWTEYDKKIKLPELSKALLQRNIVLPSGLIHNSTKLLNSTRMGFAWMNESEIRKSIGVLSETIKLNKY